MDFDELYDIARKTVNPRKLTSMAESGGVAAALLSDSGNVFTGVCIDTACSMGFCAEHAAIAAMVTAGENRIMKIIAVGWDGRIMPPCGRCREFIAQIHRDNMGTQVLVGRDQVVTIRDLLPYYWAADTRQ